ncbi:MAG: hypothetical protein SFW35_00880 [Chitinophagales bacterium]|nr:hypothetical protein [Chitinophagales bacterium]
MYPDLLTNAQMSQELLQKMILNQAYLATILKAQAQIIALLEAKEFNGVYKDMNEQINQTVKGLHLLMEEKYKG